MGAYPGHYGMYLYLLIGDVFFLFLNTLAHVKCHGIDVSYSNRVMERSLKQRGMCMYESSLQKLPLDFTHKCRR